MNEKPNKVDSFLRSKLSSLVGDSSVSVDKLEEFASDAEAMGHDDMATEARAEIKKRSKKVEAVTAEPEVEKPTEIEGKVAKGVEKLKTTSARVKKAKADLGGDGGIKNIVNSMAEPEKEEIKKKIVTRKKKIKEEQTTLIETIVNENPILEVLESSAKLENQVKKIEEGVEVKKKRKYTKKVKPPTVPTVSADVVASSESVAAPATVDVKTEISVESPIAQAEVVEPTVEGKPTKIEAEIAVGVEKLEKTVEKIEKSVEDLGGPDGVQAIIDAMPEKEKTEIEKTITALRDRIKTKQEVIHNGGDGVVDFMWDLSTQLFVKDGFKTMFHVKDNSSYNNDSRFTSIPVLSQIVGAGAFTMGIGMTAIAAPFKGVQSLGRKISLGWDRLKLGKAEKQKAKEEKATQEKAEELRKKEEITVLEKQLEVRKQCEEEAKKLGINFNTVLKQIEDAGGMDKFKRDMEMSYYHDKGGNVAGRKDLDTDGYLENIKSNKRWGAGSAMACFGFAVLFNALGGKGFDQNHIGEVLNGISSGEGAGFVDYWMLSLSTIAAGFSTIPGLQYFDNFFEEKRLKTEDSIRKLKNKLTGVIPIGYGGNKI